jgi:DsbC/DsbD-like thiol-disulfide interchange protein
MAAGGRTLRFGAALALGAAFAVTAPASATQDLVRARLLSETSAVTPGGTAWMAVELANKPGWHTYWRNPGDAGQPTDILWTLPEGYEAGGIAWPVPKPFTVEFITSYGYEDTVTLLVPVKAPASAKPGETAKVTADVNWLACEKICIPGEAKLSVDLAIAAEAPASTAAKPVFDTARAQMPKPNTVGATGAATEDTITLALPAKLAGESGEVAFLPFDDALIDHGAPQKLARGADGTATLTLKRGPKTGPLAGSFPGLLLLTDKAADRRVALDLPVTIK